MNVGENANELPPRPPTSLPQLSPRGARTPVPLIPIESVEKKKKKDKRTKRKRRGSTSSVISNDSGDEGKEEFRAHGSLNDLLKSPETANTSTPNDPFQVQDTPLIITPVKREETNTAPVEIQLLPPTPDFARAVTPTEEKSEEPETETVTIVENETIDDTTEDQTATLTVTPEDTSKIEDLEETKEEEKQPEPEKKEPEKEPEKKEPEKKEPEKKPEPPAPPQEKAITKALKRIEKAFIIDYEGRFRQTWDVIVFITLMYNWIVVPIRCGQSLVDIPPWVTTDVLSDIILWIDILLNFRTTFSQKGVNIRDGKAMAKAYAKSYLIYDLIASLPVEYIGYGLSQWYPWFRLGRIVRLVRYGYYFNNIETWSGINSSYIKLASAVGIAFIATVMMSSAYLYVLLNEQNPSTLFMLGGVDVRPLTTWQQLIRGLCWSIQTWTQYQNTQPVWDAEQIVNLIVDAVGVFLYVVFVGTVKSLLSTIDVQKEEFQTKLDSIRAFMTYRRLPTHIKDKIVDYYTYVFESRNTLNESAVLADLPLYLRQEVVMYMNRDIIAKVPIFQGLEEQFIASIVLKLKPRVGLPNSFVLQKGDIGREMFIITKGAVEVVSEEDSNGNRIVFVVLQEGSFFGEIALLTQATRNASIRCKDYCDLWVFTKSDFKEAFEKFPEEVKERILEEARKRNQAPAPAKK
jgi:hypothetical protein